MTSGARSILTEELMGRLLKLAHGLEETRTMGASLCKALDLCDGTKDIPVKLLVSDVAGHYFGVRPDDLDGKNIVIGVLLDKNVEVYLTDKTGKLRIAAFNDKEGMRLMPNEKAAAKFQAELALFAKEAADQLPPTK